LTQHPVDTELNISRDLDAVENIVKSFWDRARAAATLITQLRDEKAMHSGRVSELESQLRLLRTDLATKEQELKRLRAEHAQLLNANGHELLTGEERELLKSRVRDLIAKINSHL
jgi:chromosome segregation ATPase